MRQCLSDAALFQLTIGRKGHLNRRTGGGAVRMKPLGGMAINPGATSTIVRGLAKVPQWVAQARRSAPPDRFIPTIATAPRTRRRSG
jgi:hypothetical protein